jgi:hypothetical protein
VGSSRNTANGLLVDALDSGEDDGDGSGSDMKHPLASQLREKLCEIWVLSFDALL